jgi:RING finger protein 121
MQQPLDHQTPRLVYAWFKRIYQLCYSIGLFGYLIIMGEVFGVLQLVLSKEQCIYWFATGVLCLVYGLYFGLLGKDTAELLADRMASSIGYYNKSGLPVKHLRANVCSICGDTVDNTRIIQSVSEYYYPDYRDDY